jgi:rhodanese-related sulfurtransferase
MSKKITTVSPQQLHTIWDEGEKISLIDVRTAAEYRAGHVAGAKLIPLDQLNSETLADNVQNAGAGHEETLYLTCQSGMRAQQAAQRLIDAGYHNLALIEGGTEAWKKAGLPIRRCGNAISLERQVQIAGKQAYIDLMNGLVLEDPQLMDVAVPSNRQCGLKAAA